MKERILLPNIRYIHGFRNKEDRLIHRAYNDFFFKVYDLQSVQDQTKFKMGFSAALTHVIMNAEQLNDEDDILNIINSHFPENEADFFIEEVELKFSDEDLLMLTLHYNQKLDTKAIAIRIGKSESDTKERIEKISRMWAQDMSLEEYLTQIEKRNIFKRISEFMIPIAPSHRKKIKKPTVGEIKKVEETFWQKVLRFIS
ncbi:hypothetical protein [Flammeovirga agarivorans]|uniref:Uncharacterized protein n=1 Tax=Flammeovirga agarivorans TaxID=2726742 RepID=A0A7X8SQ93_9BACT|nr:hypothetical protein [Flammeovirga agarivorans]NLR94222.1 hypothetical protein [Flammeovirga agarivorans]